MDALEKYYTPTIEEFHVGFEYEINNPCHQGDTYYEEEVISRTNIESVLKNWKHFQEYRVKYLDQEDIESLGFVYTETDKYNPHGVKHTYIKTTSYGEVEIRHYPDTYHISIDDGNTLFSGKVKNKSELKRILKMIGYEC